MGPFYVNPGLLLKELGVDTNVFNQAGAQKADFTVTPQADVAVPLIRRGLLSATTFGVTCDRDFQFSYQAATPDVVDTSVGLFIRRAVGGKFDVIANPARHRDDYQPVEVQDDVF